MTIQIINRECQSVMGVVRQTICIDRLPAEPGNYILGQVFGITHPIDNVLASLS